MSRVLSVQTLDPVLKAADAHTTPPAVLMQTDSNAVLLRLLMMGEEARRNQYAGAERQLMPRDLVSTILRAMRMRDPAGLLHSQRMAVISSGVAKLLGWTDEQRRQLEIAAILHEIGKLGIPDRSDCDDDVSADRELRNQPGGRRKSRVVSEGFCGA
ncbi:hypothetical protein E3A20_23110 [Planctomyces bekefii]|uniref:HD-GYP domain-containing protein n=1 Tax=Planctomyces bekefii TaxID=1653850 RepID=A0A5C6M385_9PLAN|nr:hypothetical protein E3A20_23110 [Planctomyces bekefii]